MPILRRIRAGGPLGRVQDEVALAFRSAGADRVDPTRLDFVTGPNRIGGVLLVDRYGVEAGASADLDYDYPDDREIIDVWLKKTEAAGGGIGTVQVQWDDGSVVSDAMSINVADQTIVRAATIDDARHRIRSGRVRLRRVRTTSADESCIVHIVSMKVS